MQACLSQTAPRVDICTRKEALTRGPLCVRFAGLDIEWCKAPEVGLPAPDKVIYLTIGVEEAEKRFVSFLMPNTRPKYAMSDHRKRW